MFEDRQPRIPFQLRPANVHTDPSLLRNPLGKRVCKRPTAPATGHRAAGQLLSPLLLMLMRGDQAVVRGAKMGVRRTQRADRLLPSLRSARRGSLRERGPPA